MLSVNNMLNANQEYRKPSMLNINNLLNDNQQDMPYLDQIPSLSSSLASSPTSTSSYPFSHRDSTCSSNSSIISDYNYKSIKEQVNELINNTYDDDHDDDNDSEGQASIKAKRRRANGKQLEVLNKVFDRTFFPSTQMRAELGRQLGMSPRTVQIWFQNKRQAMRTKERQRLIKLRTK